MKDAFLGYKATLSNLEHELRKNTARTTSRSATTPFTVNRRRLWRVDVYRKFVNNPGENFPTQLFYYFLRAWSGRWVVSPKVHLSKERLLDPFSPHLSSGYFFSGGSWNIIFMSMRTNLRFIRCCLS